MTTKTDEQERAEFEATCRGHVDEAGYDEEALNLTRDGDGYIDKATQAAWWGWREGRAALQSQDDPLQPAANWLFKAIAECKVADIRWALRIGHNRAQRLFDHARRVEGDGE